MDQRSVIGSTTVAQVSFTTAPDASTQVIATVTDSFGNLVGVAPASSNDGVFFGIALTALEPIILTISWAATFSNVIQTVTTYVEFTGARFFTLADLRAMDPALANVTKFPDATLEKVRQSTEDEAWQIGVQYPMRFDENTQAVLGGSNRIPADLSEAALIRAMSKALNSSSGIPDRATTFQATEGGTYTLATPGRSGFLTGIPEVDAVYGRYTVYGIY